MEEPGGRVGAARGAAHLLEPGLGGILDGSAVHGHLWWQSVVFRTAGALQLSALHPKKELQNPFVVCVSTLHF